VGVRSVLFVALLAKSKVVALRTVIPEVTLFDWLEAVWLITYKPHVETI